MASAQLHHRLSRHQDGHDHAMGHEFTDLLIERGDQHARVQQRPPQCSGERHQPGAVHQLAVSDRRRRANGPTTAEQKVNSDFGFFVQDTWTLRSSRSTSAAASTISTRRVPAGVGAAGLDPGPRLRRDQNVPNWNDWSVRLAAAYDLFGNGRTALKANASKYIASAASGYAANFNGMSYSTQTRAWLDFDRNQHSRRQRQHPVQRGDRRHVEFRADHQPAGPRSRARLQLGIQRVGPARAGVGSRSSPASIAASSTTSTSSTTRPSPSTTGRRSRSRPRPIPGCRSRASRSRSSA